MKPTNSFHFDSRDVWRAWLEQNHDSETELWLIYYKKHTGEPTVQYEEAVEEALCFGWIDTTVRTIDTERYMQKYTPRKRNSGWSALNRKRAEKMILSGRMTDAGMAKVKEARKNGKWEEALTPNQPCIMPAELEEALKSDTTAWQNFNAFTKSQQNLYIGWVMSAKREETRTRRIREVVKRSALNQKPGMM
jgi:uncharacterized protein YdeI (YjbR/CyaY-like superfamily)